ncbi:MAG: efflux RND transporter periplasmic adaptor subunit [Bacteroidota bacterium]|nr:efflux RND transporter periplasmic adaptor subunit [Bacteroidota bacterium]
MEKKKKFIIWGTVVAIALIGSITMCSSLKKKQPAISFETAKATTGTISNVVTATGTIAAIKTVAVGTQVSGIINKIYVDYNSYVKKGQLLAEIDRAPLQLSLENAQATYNQATAELTYQTSNYNRIKALFDKSLIAQTDYDQALYNYQNAQATVKSAKANLDKAKVNLDYATIVSPIDGVVLSRAVDEGQTVAASFSTPTMFTIANDLTQMQVEANIDEADIGQVRNNQKVNFTVDAFPDMKFDGTVTQIRLSSTTTNNVVTYKVIINAPNPDKILMPGMTANISIEVDKAENVLTVPMKALRFHPDNEALQTYFNSLPEKDRPSDSTKTIKTTPDVDVSANAAVSKKEKKPSSVWVKKGKSVYAVPVEVGINDGISSEIKSGLKDGEEVIISMTTSAQAAKQQNATASSPFMPKRPGSSSKAKTGK